MTLVTVSDADLLALGGALPRQGFLQVWRVTGVAGKLDFAKEAEYPVRGAVSFSIDPAGAMAHRLAPRGVPAISEQWLVTVPNVDTITLSGLVTAHSVDPSTLQPLNPLPPSAAEILADASDARDVAVGVSTGLPAAAATAVGAQVQ
ncbi:hypothetical protein, partial [Plantibacter sp. YIM 135249]|uniref:hypothetical protein n=1 Tax=Plantibacter sp. YIM 135249 TaxID=3423918 RepID=UPI003D339C7C